MEPSPGFARLHRMASTRDVRLLSAVAVLVMTAGCSDGPGEATVLPSESEPGETAVLPSEPPVAVSARMLRRSGIFRAERLKGAELERGFTDRLILRYDGG